MNHRNHCVRLLEFSSRVGAQHCPLTTLLGILMYSVCAAVKENQVQEKEWSGWSLHVESFVIDFCNPGCWVFCEAQYEQYTASAKPAVILSSMSSPLELVSVSQKDRVPCALETSWTDPGGISKGASGAPRRHNTEFFCNRSWRTVSVFCSFSQNHSCMKPKGSVLYSMFTTTPVLG